MVIRLKYIIVSIRSIIFYVLITIVYRIMGKREIGELSIIDFIVSIFIAEMVAISIENYESSIFLSIIPILILVTLQIICSEVSLKNKKIRSLLDGNPSVIIEKGKINFKEMKKQRYNIDDLLTQLRGNSIKSIEEVDYAILETSGKLSIFKKSDDKKRTYPLPIIIEGEWNQDLIKKENINISWLLQEIEKEKIKLSDIFYGFYKNKKIYIIEKDKIK